MTSTPKKKTCNCNGPKTCKLHGGEYEYCTGLKCKCHEGRRPKSNPKSIVRRKKMVKVKAWVIISNGKIPIIGRDYVLSIHETRVMAHEGILHQFFVIGKGYSPKIVPVTITYSLPAKGK